MIDRYIPSGGGLSRRREAEALPAAVFACGQKWNNAAHALCSKRHTGDKKTSRRQPGCRVNMAPRGLDRFVHGGSTGR